jgi:hypothetical protein
MELPATFRKLIVSKLSTDFKLAVEVQTVAMDPVVKSLKPHQLIIKNKYLGSHQ